MIIYNSFIPCFFRTPPDREDVSGRDRTTFSTISPLSSVSPPKKKTVGVIMIMIALSNKVPATRANEVFTFSSPRVPF